MMLKLKLQYLGYLMRRVDSLEKTLMLGGIGGRRRRGQQKMRWLEGGSFSRADRGIGGVRPVAPPTWLVSNFLVRPASS